MNAVKADELKPLHDRVLVRRMEEKSNSRIIVPDCAKQLSSRGLVTQVGSKVKEVKRGDTVYFTGRWDDLNGMVDGHALIQEADIWMIEHE